VQQSTLTPLESTSRRTRSLNQCRYSLGGVGLHMGSNVHVDAQGDRHAGMPETLLDDPWIHAGFEGQGCPRMPKVVQPYDRYRCALGSRLEGS
jgi:hypothetical protein